MEGVIERTRILRIGIFLLVCCLDLSICRPAEEPTKFSLNINDESSKNAALEMSSRWEQGRSLASESQDSVVSVVSANSEYLNPEQGYPQTTQYPPVTNTRPNARETVRLESESEQSLLERPKSKAINGVLESFLKPTPLIDTISEKEKYGNSGDKFIGIGRALVNGFEGFSNFLNAVVDLPKKAVRNTSRGITEALNHVGARLIGLQ